MQGGKTIETHLRRIIFSFCIFQILENVLAYYEKNKVLNGKHLVFSSIPVSIAFCTFV